MSTIIIIILLILVYFLWSKLQKSSIRVKKTNLDKWYKDSRKDDIQFSNKIFLDKEKLKKEFNGRVRKKISQTHTRKPIEVFRGYNFKPDPDENEWEYYEGHYSELRRICSNEEIITEYQMWDYHRNYYDVKNIDGIHDSRGQMWDESLRTMRDSMFKPMKDENYDKTTKTWKDFDIDGVYLQTRSLMLGKPDFPIPNYIHLLDDRPFTYCWTLTRNYMKWKGTKRVTKLVFDNVVKWETGTIFREGERKSKELYEPLWINWNDVGKVFLQMRTKLNKEDKGGYDWLKTDVKDYINSRTSFYENLGETSKYKINDELLSKFEKLK